MYRPLLSYDELGHILEGRPSEFYDQLHKLLGLEQLTTALGRLDTVVRQLKEPSTAFKQAREALKPVLEAHPDPRAATALTQVKKTKPNLDAVRPLITEGSAATIAPAWQQAASLTSPMADDVTQQVAALRAAVTAEREEAQRSDALAADRARLLQQALTFHKQHGDQQCPVCGQGTLDSSWATAASAALEHERRTAQALTAARAATTQARAALVELIRTVAQLPTADAELTHLGAALDAYTHFVQLPVGDDVALADHVDAAFPELDRSYTALRQQAADLIAQRKAAWEPVALQLTEWVGKAEATVHAAPKLEAAQQALKWLRENADRLRNVLTGTHDEHDGGVDGEDVWV